MRAAGERRIGRSPVTQPVRRARWPAPGSPRLTFRAGRRQGKLQQAATDCNRLQQAATGCNKPQQAAAIDNPASTESNRTQPDGNRKIAERIPDVCAAVLCACVVWPVTGVYLNRIKRRPISAGPLRSPRSGAGRPVRFRSFRSFRRFRGFTADAADRKLRWAGQPAHRFRRGSFPLAITAGRTPGADLSKVPPKSGADGEQTCTNNCTAQIAHFEYRLSRWSTPVAIERFETEAEEAPGWPAQEQKGVQSAIIKFAIAKMHFSCAISALVRRMRLVRPVAGGHRWRASKAKEGTQR